MRILLQHAKRSDEARGEMIKDMTWTAYLYWMALILPPLIVAQVITRLLYLGLLWVAKRRQG